MTGPIITASTDLITSPEKTRAGFVSMALEKNLMAAPYIEEAKALKTFASKVRDPQSLTKCDSVQVGLLTAAGLSDKARNYLTEGDKAVAIQGLVDNFLVPAGNDFVDELVYRYLLVKGDALGGQARNLAGTLGERKFLRALISVFHLLGIPFQWKGKITPNWLGQSKDNHEIEKHIKVVSWTKNKKNRILVLNSKVHQVEKNVDISIINATVQEWNENNQSLRRQNDKFLAFGELKGGIDPAGADEHWKTANSALGRIRVGFEKIQMKPHLFFIGAAIEKAMADEIFKLLCEKKIHNAANLTNDDQLNLICEWIINI